MYQIIIVEDEPKIREGIINIFPWSQLGFQISAEFQEGTEALKYVEAGNPVDVVLTDIQMPNMDGIELSEKLMKYHVKVIFFSSWQKFSYAQSAILNHVIDYLVKPISYDKLYQCMERVAKILKQERQEEGEDILQSDSSLQYNAIIRATRYYIENNYIDASLDEAARRVHITPSYLSKLFKEYTGQNFSDYLSQIRMDEACLLLKNRSYKMYEIAGRVGYDNPKNFSRAFKNRYGITPQEYRNLHSE